MPIDPNTQRQRQYRRAIEDSAWGTQYSLIQVGQDRLYGDPGQGITPDWRQQGNSPRGLRERPYVHAGADVWQDVRPLFTLEYETEVLSDAPVGYWRLGEPSGGTAYDSSGNQRNGTNTNSPTLGQGGAIIDDADTAYAFDGVGAFVNCQNPGGVFDFTNAFTLECWVRGDTDVGTFDRFVAKGQASGGVPGTEVYGMLTDGSFQPYSFIRIGGTEYNSASGTRPSLRDNLWHHVVTTYDGETLLLYVDGVQTSSNTTPTGSCDTSTETLKAGVARDGYFKGRIDEFAVYNTVLTAARIQAHHTAGIRNLLLLSPPDWREFGTAPWRPKEKPYIHGVADSKTNLSILPVEEATIPEGVNRITERYRSLWRLNQHHAFTDPLLNTLESQDTFYSDPGQAITFGVTERYRPKWLLNKPHIWTDPLLNTLESQDTFYSAPGQAITFGITQRYRPLWRLLQQHIWPDVSLNVLDGQDALYGAPGQVNTFGVTERYRPKWIPNWQHAWKYLPVLESQDSFYGAIGQAITFGITERYRSRWLPNWGSLAKILPVLEGQDTFYGDIGQAITFGITERYRPRWLLNQHHRWAVLPVLEAADSFYGDPGQAVTFGVTQKYRPLWLLNKQHILTDPLLNVLEAQDSFYGDQGQAITFGVTQRYRPLWLLNKHYIWTDPSLNVLSGQDIVYGDPGQVPGIALQPYTLGRFHLRDAIWFNSLTNTLAEEALPGIQRLLDYYFITPRLYQGHTELAPLLGVLGGQDTFYGDTGQVITFGITQRYRSLWIPNRQYLKYALPIMEGQDTFYGDAGQAITYGITEQYRSDWRLNQHHIWLDPSLNVLSDQDTIYGAPGQVNTFGVTEKYRPLWLLNKFHIWTDPPLNVLVAQDSFYGDPGQVVTFGVTQRYRPLWIPNWQHLWTDPVLNLLAEQDSFYGAPGQSITPDWTQQGSQLALMRKIAQAEKSEIHSQNDLVQALLNWTLLGQDIIYGDPGLIWPPDWKQFGLYGRPKEQQHRHSENDVWQNWNPIEEAIEALLLHMSPDWRMFGPPEKGYPLLRSRELWTWIYLLLNSTLLPGPPLYVAGVRVTTVYHDGRRTTTLYKRGERLPLGEA